MQVKPLLPVRSVRNLPVEANATMVAFAIVLVLTGVLFVVVPKGFIPEQDTDQISVVTEAAQGTAYDKLVEYQGQVAEIIERDPNVEALVSTIGGNASMTLGGPNLGQIVVHLKPRSDRKQAAAPAVSGGTGIRDRSDSRMACPCRGETTRWCNLRPRSGAAPR